MTHAMQKSHLGGKGGCKLVLMKMGNNPGKTQPPESPFIKGDLKGLSSDRGGKDYEGLFDRQYGLRWETDTPGFARK